MTVRIAKVALSGRDTAETVAAYLPQNYRVLGVLKRDAEDSAFTGDTVLIGGTDNHGWTLDDYVIPRLGSGMMRCTEIKLDLEHIGGES